MSGKKRPSAPAPAAAPGPDLAQEKMRVENFEILGNLVKSWSTGDASYTGGTLYPEPTTPQELAELLRLLGAVPTIPKHVTKLTLVRYGVNEMVLRIPPAALIKAKEKRLKTTPYAVPEFYKDNPIKGTEPGATAEEKLALQAKRIGDYTIAHCE